MAFLLVPAAVAALLAFWNLNFGLPFLYRPDEDTILGRAIRMVVQHSVDPIYPNWLPLGFYFYAAAEAIANLFGANNLHAATAGDPTSAILVGRILSASLEVLTTVLVFLAGRRAYGLPAGIIAAAAVAVAPLTVRQAHFATVDGIMTMFVAGCLLATVSARSTRGYLLAGILAGLAASIKYNGALAFVLPAAMAVQFPRRWRRLTVAGAGAACAFAATSFAIALHPHEYLHTAAFLARDLSRHRSPEPLGWIFDPLVVFPFGLGFGTYALVLAGGAVAALRRWPVDVTLLAFCAAYLLVLGSGHENFYRYLLPMFPALFLLGGAWVAALPARTVPLGLAAGALLLAPSLYASVSMVSLLGQTDTRTEAAGWVERNVPPGTAIEASYYASPFYDIGLVRHQSRYIGGSELAASFLQGRFTTRYTVRIGEHDSATVFQHSSGPPWQGPVPVTQGALFQVSPYATGADPRQSVYDPLDSFYLPFWGFQGLQRMGPAIAISRTP